MGPDMTLNVIAIGVLQMMQTRIQSLMSSVERSVFCSTIKINAEKKTHIKWGSKLALVQH